MNRLVQIVCICNAAVENKIKYSQPPTTASSSDTVLAAFLVKAVYSAHAFGLFNNRFRTRDLDSRSIFMGSVLMPCFRRAECGGNNMYNFIILPFHVSSSASGLHGTSHLFGQVVMPEGCLCKLPAVPRPE